MLVHNEACGVDAAKGKELLYLKIEKQIELGGEGLDKQDCWLLDIILSNLESLLGPRVGSKQPEISMNCDLINSVLFLST